MSDDRFQLTAIRFVKRVVLGSQGPSPQKSKEEIEQAAALTAA